MILVAYASRHGSTEEVARTVAAVLREQELDVALRRAAEVDDVRGYDGVVVGGSIYMGRWHADARRFLRRHGAAMSRTTLAVFGMGPRTLDPDEVAESRKAVERALDGVDPARIGVFGGVIDPAKLGFPLNRMPASDARDWDAIEAWAADFADLVRQNAPHTMRACTVLT